MLDIWDLPDVVKEELGTSRRLFRVQHLYHVRPATHRPGITAAAPLAPRSSNASEPGGASGASPGSAQNPLARSDVSDVAGAGVRPPSEQQAASVCLI